MDYNVVKELIEKYFLAETSLQDEKALKEYFAGGNVHPDLEMYCAIFGNEVPDKLDNNFDEKILLLIDSEKSVKKSATVRNIFPNWLKIAAIFILFLAGGVLVYNNYRSEIDSQPTAHVNNVHTNQIEDTYSDPEQARRELEKALALISSKMNQANEATAQQVSRLEVISKVIPESSN